VQLFTMESMQYFIRRESADNTSFLCWSYTARLNCIGIQRLLPAERKSTWTLFFEDLCDVCTPLCPLWSA